DLPGPFCMLDLEWYTFISLPMIKEEDLREARKDPFGRVFSYAAEHATKFSECAICLAE
ncbi:hypothetical protein HAX54_047872, partial [Datura stramonium]|nr:hypothetical protein [Datura stramonium]